MTKTKAKQKTHTDKILSHLNRGWKLTKAQALSKYSIQRATMAARVAELRRSGHNIITEMVKHEDGSREGVYRLVR